jgi:D-glycero-D-manno-heptose 1,7-bisphosphate phosphatase
MMEPNPNNPSSPAIPPVPPATKVLRTAFLDRDGVLNKKMPEGEYVASWEQFQILPGVVQAIRALNRAGLRVIVVSNQRGIALGRVTLAEVEGIHARFAAAIEADGAHIDAFYFCPHDKNACNCRKPLPGLFDQARNDFHEITPETSIMIGDSLSDIRFGNNLGLRTIFIEGDPLLRKAGAEEARSLAGQSAENLLEAVASFLPSELLQA